MGVEFEVKFRATPEILEKLRQELPGEETHFSMETTYYDTPAGELAAKHFTLRRRMENQVSVCTLKTPAGRGRNEYEVVAPTIEDALPELCKLSGHALPTGIQPICGAKFNRIAKILTVPGAVAELALDTGILTGGGKELPLCELELELKAGDPAALVLYAAGLSATYSLEEEKHSKFRRALALSRGEML